MRKHTSADKQDVNNMVNVTVRVPKNNARGIATSSGKMTREGVRYRRCLLTSCRLLYLNAVIRQHHEADLRNSSAEDLKLAAIRAILSDLPSTYLRELSKDPRVQQHAVISERKLRKRILKEIKAEVREKKQDPMTILKATINQSVYWNVQYFEAVGFWVLPSECSCNGSSQKRNHEAC